MAEFVYGYFEERGVDVELKEVLPNRPNVIARVAGRDRSRQIIFEAHLDTVATVGMTIDPFEPCVKDGKMFGRGSCDTKGGMAAMMHAVAEVVRLREQPSCDVVFAGTIDEEFSYRGVADYCRGLTAEAAIVAEPTELKPVVASKGLVRFVIATTGVAAHSAKPHLGKNAIEQMARVIQAIQADAGRLSKQRHALLGPATCNIGVIRGGVQINFVPASCEIEIDRRLLPGETIDGVLANYQSILDELAKEHSIEAKIGEPLLTDVPLETRTDTQVVETIRNVLADLGHDDQPIGVPFCSDASKFGAVGIPSIILGPGNIDQAHAAIEYIECDQVIAAAEVYRRFILQFE